MGIDIYLRYKGMTKAEYEAQYCGFSVTSGHVGYLREAYHGDPYATKVLVPEAFAVNDVKCTHESADDETDCFCYYIHIPAKTLRKRLWATLLAAAERDRLVYKTDPPTPGVLKAYMDFVALAERLEAEGKQPMIMASY